MSQGCPVIARDAMGLRDYVTQGNGVLFKTEDELVKSMLKVLSSPKQMRKMVANGHKTVQKYSIQNSTKQLLKIYESILEKT